MLNIGTYYDLGPRGLNTYYLEKTNESLYHKSMHLLITLEPGGTYYAITH